MHVCSCKFINDLKKLKQSYLIRFTNMTSDIEIINFCREFLTVMMVPSKLGVVNV